MNGWIAAGVIGACSAAYVTISVRKWRRMAAALAQQRDNPTREQFVIMLDRDADAQTAEWLWRELQVYWGASLTPHPDDDFLRDLPIDHDEPNDWVERYCRHFDLPYKDVAQWPDADATTVRNLARWLSSERVRLNTG